MAAETEVRIQVDSARETASLLEKLGAVVVARRELEDNRLYDRDDHTLDDRGITLRIRTTGDRSVLTVKAPHPAHRTRREEEIEIADADAMARALELLGYVPLWRYQKYRTCWQLDDATVTLDETPHDCFIEIEAALQQIDRIAARLGHSPGDYSGRPHSDFHREWCKQAGRPFGDMLFEEE